MATPIEVKLGLRDDSERFNDVLTKTNDQVCRICLENKFKYTCPRCNLVYCSLACYKDEKHTGCSEAFYKDCVIQELQDMRNEPEDKQKVIEMLKRNLEEQADQEESEEDEDEADLAERLSGLDLDKDIGIVWNRLSAKEKEEFARMFQDGRLANLIEIWTPWWKCPDNLNLVQEEKKEAAISPSCVPEILCDVPDINSLLKNGRPSSDCRYDVINILFAYSFVTRIHNGSHQECPVDSGQLLLDVCVVLGKQGHCGSVGEAIQLAVDSADQIGKKSKESSSDFNLSILDDLEVLMAGPSKAKPSLSFMSAALSDLIRLFRASLSVIKKELKSNKSQNSSAGNLQPLKSSVFKAEKKAMFLLSWLQRYGMSIHQLLPLLQLEKDLRQGALQEVKEMKSTVESNIEKLKPKPASTERKIVELS